MEVLEKIPDPLKRKQTNEFADEAFDMPSSPESLHVPTPKELLVKGIRFDVNDFKNKKNHRILFIVPPGSVEENYGSMVADSY